jgi:formylglycine-generating enzyme required for sulfatase activity
MAPPAGQVVLWVDTDAPLAAAGSPPSLDEPLPLFDHIRVDVAPPGASTPCDGCNNDFALDADAFDAGKVSFGIAPPAGAPGWTARVRLYLGRFSIAGEPDPETSLDTTVALPVIAADGVVEAGILLLTDDVGRRLGATAPIDPTPGPRGPSLVGTWAGASRTTCAGAPPSGMACVPGGAFWMGGPGDHVVPGAPTTWHRLVVLSPFFLDDSELSVAAARALGLDPSYVFDWSGSSGGSSSLDWCTYTTAPGPRDALPVTCVTQVGAASLCQARGLVLPSEAQLEYAMGGARMQPYVWGRDTPACDDAVWGRNGAGITSTFTPQTCFSFTAHALHPLDGTEAPGRGARDRLVLATGTLLDLNGNVAEWALDAYQDRTEPCWAKAGVLRDPVCRDPSPSQGLQAVTRGGNWLQGGVYLEADERSELKTDETGIGTGLRCAKAGR